MKKVALFATALILSAAVMAQTESKQPTSSATKVPRNLTSKTKNETAPSKVSTVPTKVVAAPAKDEVKTTTTQTTPQTQPAESQISPDAVIKMNTEKHDFGKIPQGTPVVYSFEIKNTSNKPVVVENTSASCGCTTPDKITEPILPGATAKLKVQYSAAGVGQFTKDVHIKLAGIATPKTVTIVGEVTAPEPPKSN